MREEVRIANIVTFGATAKSRRMTYGYARVSTEGPDLTGQVSRLRTTGCAAVSFYNSIGNEVERPQLPAAELGAGGAELFVAATPQELARREVVLHAFEGVDAVARVVPRPEEGHGDERPPGRHDGEHTDDHESSAGAAGTARPRGGHRLAS